MPFVRDDDRERLRRVWYGVYADVRQELRLKSLESNVLATLQHDKVLDAVTETSLNSR